MRVTGRGHLSRCGTVAFFIGDGAPTASEVWVDFGAGVVVPVERCMIESAALIGESVIVDPVSGGLEALRTSWPGLTRAELGKAGG